MVVKIVKRRMACFRKAPAAAQDFAEAVDASNYRTSLTPGRWPHRDMSQEYPQTGRRNAETKRTLHPVMQLLTPYIRIKEPKFHAYILSKASLFCFYSQKIVFSLKHPVEVSFKLTPHQKKIKKKVLGNFKSCQYDTNTTRP